MQSVNHNPAFNATSPPANLPRLRLKAHKQLPVLRAALAELQRQNAIETGLAPNAVAA